MSQEGFGLKETRVALIGMMGAGKSTVGALLAKRLGCVGSDLDGLVSDDDAEGRHCSDILRAVGEAAFRDLEYRALRRWVGTCEGRAVISLGGGAVLQSEIRAMLSGSDFWVGWLDSEPAALARRLTATTTDRRPLLGDAQSSAELAARLSALCAERENYYLETADFRVDTTERTPEEVMALILAQLPGGAP